MGLGNVNSFYYSYDMLSSKRLIVIACSHMQSTAQAIKTTASTSRVLEPEPAVSLSISQSVSQSARQSANWRIRHNLN